MKFAALADLAAVGFIIIRLESIRLMMCVLLLSSRWHPRRFIIGCAVRRGDRPLTSHDFCVEPCEDMPASWLPAVSFVLKAWVINFAFSFSFAYFPTKTASEIKFVGGTPAWGINLLQNAFFCGLFTPVFSCYFVKKLVRDGRIAAIPEQELTEAGVRCLVHRNPCINTLLCGW